MIQRWKRLVDEELGLASASADRIRLTDWLHHSRELVAFCSDDLRLVLLGDGFRDAFPLAAEPGAELCNILPKFADPAVRDALLNLREVGMALDVDMPHPATGVRINAHVFRTGVGFGVIVQPTVKREGSSDHGEVDTLLHWATRDSLTGLQNRRVFSDSLAGILAGLGRSKMGVALLQIDLDDFKAVNDTLGHGAGDALLQLVARRIEEALDRNAVGFRYAGDEFTVIQTADGQPQAAERLADTIISRLRVPFEISGIPVFIGASVGIAFGIEHGSSTEQLMKAADIALYAAKSEGRGRARIFNNAMLLFLESRESLRRDLRKALQRGELFVEYQPVVRLPVSVVAFEALVRWRHPDAGVIAPGAFISIAEADGLMDEIGQWVLEQACTDALEWPPTINIAVNLSPAQFRSGMLTDNVAKILDRVGIYPERLEFEITETVLLEQTTDNLDTLHTLGLLGVRVLLDDFGTSYSSLGYLKDFSFSGLKVDKYFIRDLEVNPKSQTIVRSILGLAHGLGMTVTAEGVETDTQAKWLAREGCDRLQGFLIAPPLSNRDAIEFIQRARHGAVA
ncbi:putative bifunctional diguanylate cyclase/phosphodiesterase [Inquilinus sp. OTU3971]|uniref:putative bifunctional diguanylate cyclase/phosphodiesterase n=1 Tax=Inquilinus sp. OTU3971 TaxID=3043855 RepID=UPI00313DC6B0